MDANDINGISAWVVERGLCGDSEIVLLQGFCERCYEAGLLLSRGVAIIDTLHPVYEGRAFFWARDKAVASPVSEYGPSTSANSVAQWQGSPFYYLLQGSDNELRRRLETNEPTGFSVIDELRAEGQTDYIAFIQRFGHEAAIGEMDCFLSRWLTMKPGGFSDADIGALRRLVPLLGLAIKSTSLARVAQSLVETYLGRDAGRRVLAGRMSRGAVDKIHAVLWFSDIRGYTALSEEMASDQLIPLLDDYAEAVISAIHGAGGDVLKLIGDGVLAIFNADDPAAASRAALQAEAALQLNLAALKERRAAAGMPIASIYIGMHIGESSTAISAARIASTSPSSARPSTKRAVSRRCARQSGARYCSRPISWLLCRPGKVEVRVSRPLRAARRAPVARTVHARSHDER